MEALPLKTTQFLERLTLCLLPPSYPSTYFILLLNFILYKSDVRCRCTFENLNCSLESLIRHSKKQTWELEALEGVHCLLFSSFFFSLRSEAEKLVMRRGREGCFHFSPPSHPTPRNALSVRWLVCHVFYTHLTRMHTNLINECER